MQRERKLLTFTKKNGSLEIAPVERCDRELVDLFFRRIEKI
jgi:hypothetical protein